MADAPLIRRMTVRLEADAVAFAQIGIVALDGQIELEALSLYGLPSAVLALLYRIVEEQRRGFSPGQARNRTGQPPHRAARPARAFAVGCKFARWSRHHRRMCQGGGRRRFGSCPGRGCAGLGPGAWKPARPITVVVPFGAGTGTDAITRIVAGLLEPEGGQPVVVENRASANGALAAAQVTCAVPVGACERPPGRAVTRIDTYFGAVQSGACLQQARAVDGTAVKPMVIPRCLPARPAV